MFFGTIQTLIKYGIHFFDTWTDGEWENRGTYIIYTELFTDSLSLLTMLGYYFQLLLVGGVSFSFYDFVVFFHVRSTISDLIRKINSFRNYVRLSADLNNKFPNVTQEELEQLNDYCAICRRQMLTAKKLPCNHVFHMSCIKSWMEHHHSCPTCRRSMLTNEQQNPQQAPGADNRGPTGESTVIRFNVDRFLSWFPSFSITVRQETITPEMIQNLQNAFPHISPMAIAEDVARTHSLEITSDNILAGRLPFWGHSEEIHEEEPQFEANQEEREPVNEAAPPANVSPPTIYQETEENDGSNSSDSSSDSSIPPIVPTELRKFAGTASERQTIQQLRKQALLSQARRRFLEKSQPPKPPTTTTTSTSTSTTSISPPPSAYPEPPVNIQSLPENSPPPQPAEVSIQERRQKALEAAQLRLRLARENNDQTFN
jgi:hypothetical protein